MTTKAGFLGHKGKLWSFIASWFVPVVMTIAYTVLALTSETDATGWAWMSIGLAFVLVLWWLFRTLTKSAAMTRALAIGDSQAILAIDARPMSHAVAHEMGASWMKALSVLDRVDAKTPRDRVLAGTVKIGALVETGEVAKARIALDALAPDLARLNPRLDAPSHLAVDLAKGRVLAAERANVEALAVLDKLIADIRTGQWTRALAHHYAARAAAADGQHAAADAHRAQAEKLAPDGWFV